MKLKIVVAAAVQLAVFFAGTGALWGACTSAQNPARVREIAAMLPEEPVYFG